MDNGNFEQQFTQNLKSMPMQSAGAGSASGKLPLIIAVALAAVLLVESIALVITLTGYISANSEEFSEEESYISDDEIADDKNYVYDADYNLTALGITCKNSNGDYYKLTTDNKYEQYGSSGLTSSGTYSVNRDRIISLTATDGKDRVLYYDFAILADGNTIYECGEDAVTE